MVLEPKNVNESNRRHFSPEKKFEIVKEILIGLVPKSGHFVIKFKIIF